MARLRTATLLVLAVLLIPCLLVQADSPNPTQGLWPGPGASSPPDVRAKSPSSSGCKAKFVDGQLIEYCIPHPFNGTLLVYAHGYADPNADLVLPAELSLPEWQSLLQQFLSMGFGFATTSYSKNGAAVEQAEGDLLALVDYVKRRQPKGAVKKVLLLGVSEGGLITTMMVEKHPDVFAGGLAMCGPVGGMPYQVDYMGDFRVVFDYFFPNVFDFGAVNIPEDAYLYWDDYASDIATAVAGDPEATDQLFSVRLVNGTTVARDPLNPLATSVAAAQELLRYNIVGTNDLIATAGGQPYDNTGRWYWGSSDDVALNLGVERVSGSSAARDYVATYYQPTGALSRPLVTMHTTGDWVVPFRHEAIYLARAVTSGGARYLTVLPVPRCGHCTFTESDLLGALGLLLLRTGLPVNPELQQHMQALPAPLQ